MATSLDWYGIRGKKAAGNLNSILRDTFVEISLYPDQFPKYMYGPRTLKRHRFPFTIGYHYGDWSIRIIALADTQRRPGYWRRRLAT